MASAESPPDVIKLKHLLGNTNITLMLVGAAGAGKSSLINSLIKLVQLSDVSPHGKFNSYIPTATAQLMGGDTMKRESVDVTDTLTVLDNRGWHDWTNEVAIRELIAQIRGERYLEDDVNWETGAEDALPFVVSPKVDCISIVINGVGGIAAMDGIRKLIDTCRKHIGRRPSVVITHKDELTDEQIERMTDTLESYAIERHNIFVVQNVTTSNDNLEADSMSILCKLINRCIIEGNYGANRNKQQDKRNLIRDTFLQQLEDVKRSKEITNLKHDVEVAKLSEAKIQLENAEENVIQATDAKEEVGQSYKYRSHSAEMSTKRQHEDDTDNNEGNGDQLTSLKHDSESRDDVSCGGLSAPPEILARGQRARQAYAEAAQAGTKKVFRTRLMLVGQERVGKTSLKKTLTGQGFDQNEAITDGVETTNACEICIEVAKAGGKMWSIHKKGHGSEETKEDEYRKALADEIAKRLIVAPPQDQESLEPHSYTSLSRGLTSVKAEDANEIAQKLTVTPLTQQQDQESLEPHSDTTFGRGLNPEEAEDVVLNSVEKILKEQVRLKEIGTDSTDSSRGEGVSLSIWDFAGHDVYYTTHQMFLTWRAIYVIVFDLSRSLDYVAPPESRNENYEMQNSLEFINFWLCSIFAHAVAPSSVKDSNTSKNAQKSPPIFIVGTHRESVKGDAKEKKKKIGSAFEKIRKSIMTRPFECHVVPKYYAIENSFEDKDEELVELRRHIEKVAMEEPYMGEEIPLRWLLFEEALAADKINYMSLDQTKELTEPIRMESEHELPTMLTFYHDLGYVVYYGGMEEQQSLLRDLVILNPQWLIDVFKQVITILDPANRDGIVNDAWTTLEKDGILEDRLIQHMWQGFLEQKEALVQLMAKFDLICEAPVARLQQEQQDGVDDELPNETEKMVKKRYYVPSRLTSRCPPEEIAQIKSSTDFYVDFRRFLPDGLFHRLMTRAVRWIGERDGQPVNLFYRHISLMVDDVHHALLEMLPPREATIKVTVFRGAVADSDHDGDIHKPPAPSAVKEVMDFVTETLESLIQHWARRIEYDICFLCPSRGCSKKKLLKECSKGMSLKCGLHNIRKTAIRDKFGMNEDREESMKKSPVMPRISTCNGSNVLSDRYFSDLAKRIGSEWQQLGIRLGLSQADIEHITEDNLRAVGRIVAMLQLWKKQSSCTDKRGMVEELCTAMSSCGMGDLEEKVKTDSGFS